MITNAFKNSRSGYTLGCPRPRLVASWGIGKRSTRWTNVTSNVSWDTIGLPPILVVVDDHNDRSKSSLEQPSRVGFLFMTRPRLDIICIAKIACGKVPTVKEVDQRPFNIVFLNRR